MSHILLAAARASGACAPATWLLLACLVVATLGCASSRPAPATQAPTAAPATQAPTATPATQAPTAAPAPARAAVTSTRGLVASAHPLASEAGVAMLRAGGNAVDAAVAAAFAVGVAEPNASGLGGEGMMLVHLAATGTTVAIDYRSVAPRETTFTGGVPDTGYRAVAVPGTVAGLALALDKYGSKPLADVIAPAIRLAEHGFVVTPTLANAVTENFAAILEDEPLSAVFCPNGLPIEAGARLTNPALASTLRRIAAGGATAFYRGEIADRVAQAMSEKGGFISRADLEGYSAIERRPVRGRYRGHDIVSAPPPVGGVAVIEALQILDQFDVRAFEPFSVARVHLTAEALKRGFADYSAYVADPAFVTIPLAGLTSAEYARARAAEIRVDAISPKIGAGQPAESKPSAPGDGPAEAGPHEGKEAGPPEGRDAGPHASDESVRPAEAGPHEGKEAGPPEGRDAGPHASDEGVRPAEAGPHASTTSLAVIDGRGNVVVVTQTISDFFGAKVMVPGTGIILNNEMKNFGSRGINAMAPGKRMRTTIAPTIVLEGGRAMAALGTPGAARIVSTMVLLVSNLLDYRMGIQEAIDAPRFYVRETEPLALEDRIPEATRRQLESMGYTLDVHGAFDLFFGGAQGIVRDPATGRLTGGADPRRDGAVVAY